MFHAVDFNDEATLQYLDCFIFIAMNMKRSWRSLWKMLGFHDRKSSCGLTTINSDCYATTIGIEERLAFSRTTYEHVSAQRNTAPVK